MYVLYVYIYVWLHVCYIYIYIYIYIYVYIYIERETSTYIYIYIYIYILYMLYSCYGVHFNRRPDFYHPLLSGEVWCGVEATSAFSWLSKARLSDLVP